jgi:hypothetical protein|tara:strand:+ start:135 stop:353 length:219 start_codon:yes stop_codon:yes gene_type:complete
MRVIDYFDESMDYIRYPQYVVLGTLFLVGFGITGLSLTLDDTLTKTTLFLGGCGLVIMGIAMTYSIHMNDGW